MLNTGLRVKINLKHIFESVFELFRFRQLYLPLTYNETSLTTEQIAMKVGNIASNKVIDAHYETVLNNSVRLVNLTPKTPFLS